MAKRKQLKEESRFLKPLSWVMVIAFLMGAMYLANLNAGVFQTSLLPQKVHKPFDGTVLPVQKAPDWVKLSGDEWNYTYDQLAGLGKIIDIPAYNPDELVIPVSSLEWRNPAHDMIRNEKITYSVPYMGNYELDGVENVGSHLAVDIKLPNGTPVYAIANGIVTKVTLQSSGFGKHIVITHENSPTLEDGSANETFYSCYAHLGDLMVAEGEIVEKGRQIGVTGESGIATTPHLHFQLDNDLAPWHPFWPFTYQESVDAGYSFFEAINAGLGKELALANTVNPMKYAQKYLNYAAEIEPEPEPDPEPQPEPEPEPDVIEPQPEPEPEPEIIPQATYKFEHDGEFEIGKPEKIKFVITSGGGYPFKFDDLIVMSSFTGDAEFGQKLFSAMNLTDNYFEFFVTPTSSKTLRIKATLSDKILLVSDPLNAKAFSDVPENHRNYKAIRYLYNQGVISGYGDGTFRPSETVTRVEALKMILAGIQKELENTGDLPFPDVLTNTWYSAYVETAYKDGVVSGYPDNTFKPANEVNKAEFFKMLLLAMEIDIDPEVAGDVFEDVPADMWFAPYVQFVKNKNLLDIFENMFAPEDGMTRGDVAEAMFRVMILAKTSADKFSLNLVEGIVM